MSHSQQNQPSSQTLRCLMCLLLLLVTATLLRNVAERKRPQHRPPWPRCLYNHNIHTMHIITSVHPLHCDQCQWSGVPMPAAEQWRPADWCEAQLRATSHYTSRDKRWHTFYNHRGRRLEPRFVGTKVPVCLLY